MRNTFRIVMVVSILSGLLLTVQAAELTELQKKARSLLNKETVRNVVVEELKGKVPALQGGQYSGLVNAASEYLGGNTGIARTLTQSLQDAQTIYTHSMNLMEITRRIGAKGADINALTTADLQQILTSSQNIYNSSTRIMDLVRTNAELYNTLTGAYNQLTTGTGDWNSRLDMLLKVLPYLKK